MRIVQTPYVFINYQRPLSGLIEGDTKDYSSYLNCFWFMIITMSTVGYGDFYPRTIPGRWITFLGAIVGVILVSLLVVALTNTLNMSNAECKARKINYNNNFQKR